MRRIVPIYGVLILAVTFFFASAAGAAPVSDADHQAILNQISTYVNGIATHDMSKIKSVQTSNFSVLSPDGKRLGNADRTYSNAYNQLQSGSLQGSVDYMNAKWNKDDNGAVSVTLKAHANARIDSGNGAPITTTRNATHKLTFVQQDGKWLLDSDQILAVSKG
jgi:hypothetical protein